MPNVNLHTIDFIVMAIYVVVLIAWGLYHSKRQNAEDYFLGGRGMAWWLVGLSMFSTVVSSSSLVGWSGDCYSTGISVFNYGISAAIIPIIFVLIFFLPFYLRNKVYTLPEFLEGRFDARSRYYLCTIALLSYTFIDSAVTLYAGSLMIQMIFPSVDLRLLIWGLAIVAASYTLVGGLSAVMFADVLQAAILFIGSVVLTCISFDKAGGWSAVMHAVPAGHTSLIRPVNDPSVPWPALLITLPLLGFYYWGTSQAMVQRTLSAKNINHGRWGNLFAAALNFVIFFVMVLPGLSGRVLFPHLDKPDQVYPKLVFEVLPPGLVGLVVTGFLAALTAALASTLNSAATIFTMDVGRKIKPDMTSKQQVLVGNIAGLVIICVAALWAPQIQKFDSVVKYFQELLSFVVPPVVAVFVLGLFWKRASGTGAFAGLMSGLGIAILLALDRKVFHATPLADMNFLYVAPIIFVLSGIIIVLVSQLTAPPSEAKVASYVWKSSAFAEESAELAALPWYQNYRYLSVLLLVVTAIFVFIWR
jgi:SSS family solute:Na+ symporter